LQSTHVQRAQELLRGQLPPIKELLNEDAAVVAAVVTALFYCSPRPLFAFDGDKAHLLLRFADALAAVGLPSPNERVTTRVSKLLQAQGQCTQLYQRRGRGYDFHPTLEVRRLIDSLKEPDSASSAVEPVAHPSQPTAQMLEQVRRDEREAAERLARLSRLSKLLERYGVEALRDVLVDLQESDHTPAELLAVLDELTGRKEA
jgi:muconolactone delta-isomerase